MFNNVNILDTGRPVITEIVGIEFKTEGVATNEVRTFGYLTLRESNNFFQCRPIFQPNFTKTGDGASSIRGPLNVPIGAILKIIGLSDDGKSVFKGQAVFLGYQETWEIVTNNHSLKGEYDEIPNYMFHIVDLQKPIKLKKRMRMTNKGLVNNLSIVLFSFFRRTNTLIYVNGEFFMKRVFSVFNVFQNDVTDATDDEVAIYMNENTYADLINKGRCIEGFAYVFGFPFYGNMAIAPVKVIKDMEDGRIDISPTLATYILRDMDGDIIYVMGIPRIKMSVVKQVCEDLNVAAPELRTKKIGGSLHVDLESYSMEELYSFFGLIDVKEWRRLFDDESKSVVTLLKEWKEENAKKEAIRNSTRRSHEELKQQEANEAFINSLKKQFLG